MLRFCQFRVKTSAEIARFCLSQIVWIFARFLRRITATEPPFYAAIQGVHKADLDLTDWLEYFEGLATQPKKAQAHGNRAVQLATSIQKVHLSPRQMEVLRYLLIHPSMNIQDFKRICSAVARHTLQRDLGDLLNRGFLRQIASSPIDSGRCYELNPDLWHFWAKSFACRNRLPASEGCFIFYDFFFLRYIPKNQTLYAAFGRKECVHWLFSAVIGMIHSSEIKVICLERYCSRGFE